MYTTKHTDGHTISIMLDEGVQEIHAEQLIRDLQNSPVVIESFITTFFPETKSPKDWKEIETKIRTLSISQISQFMGYNKPLNIASSKKNQDPFNVKEYIHKRDKC